MSGPFLSAIAFGLVFCPNAHDFAHVHIDTFAAMSGDKLIVIGDHRRLFLVAVRFVPTLGESCEKAPAMAWILAHACGLIRQQWPTIIAAQFAVDPDPQEAIGARREVGVDGDVHPLALVRRHVPQLAHMPEILVVSPVVSLIQVIQLNNDIIALVSRTVTQARVTVFPVTFAFALLDKAEDCGAVAAHFPLPDNQAQRVFRFKGTDILVVEAPAIPDRLSDLGLGQISEHSDLGTIARVLTIGTAAIAVTQFKAFARQTAAYRLFIPGQAEGVLMRAEQAFIAARGWAKGAGYRWTVAGEQTAPRTSTAGTIPTNC